MTTMSAFYDITAWLIADLTQIAANTASARNSEHKLDYTPRGAKRSPAVLLAQVAAGAVKHAGRRYIQGPLMLHRQLQYTPLAVRYMAAACCSFA